MAVDKALPRGTLGLGDRYLGLVLGLALAGILLLHQVHLRELPYPPGHVRRRVVLSAVPWVGDGCPFPNT